MFLKLYTLFFIFQCTLLVQFDHFDKCVCYTFFILGIILHYCVCRFNCDKIRHFNVEIIMISSIPLSTPHFIIQSHFLLLINIMADVYRVNNQYFTFIFFLFFVFISDYLILFYSFVLRFFSVPYS